MWYRSASGILDKRRNDTVLIPETRPATSSASPMASENPHPQQKQNPDPHISLYYQTRAAHHAVVTSDWLAQAQAAVGRHRDDTVSDNSSAGGEESGNAFSVIDEFNNWRKQPDLAEAVAAIRALASVIRSSQATTMMELEIELKKASDSLKVREFVLFIFL